MTQNAIILGAGTIQGLGGAIARRFAREGLHVFVSGRTLSKVETVAQAIRDDGGQATAIACDVTSPSDQDALFTAAEAAGPIAAVLYNAGNNALIPFEKLTAEQFEDVWRVGCLGAFHTAKRALPTLERQGRGTLVFTGASGSLRGKPNFAHFASAKGALRNLAQSLAREYGPRGVHVGHIIIDGVIDGERAREGFGEYLASLGEDGALQPGAIAEAFWTLHAQPRSAWSHELDLRPFKEAW
ncbi:MAG: SDR family NAD(P)-dependent oxidoreductase [Pseudomonadota bacterium]